MAETLPLKLKLKCRDKKLHEEHELHAMRDIKIKSLERKVKAHERRERKEKRRQQSRDLFKQSCDKFIRIINKRELIVCGPPTGLESTSNDTSIPCQLCQSHMDSTKQICSPATQQEHVDYLVQARLDLIELKTFCREHALENGYRKDRKTGMIITKSPSKATVRTEGDYQDLIRLVRSLRSEELDSASDTVTDMRPYLHGAVEWINYDGANARPDGDKLTFNERQQADWTYVKKRQEQYWAVAEMDPHYAKQMRSIKATTFSSMPDNVSHSILRCMALKLGAWKSHGRLLNGAQLMMARDTFKPRREMLASGSSKLCNEYQPNNESKEFKRIDSFAYMVDHS